jgi:threonine dehydratase
MAHRYTVRHGLGFQGTIAIEFLDQVKDLDAVLVPIGGGGILAGIATYIAHVQPELPGTTSLQLHINRNTDRQTDRSDEKTVK